MRLIDADALKEWVENWFIMNRHYHPFAKSNNIPIPELYDILERMPTIDAVPVMRCNQYKHYDGVHNFRGCAPCLYWNSMVLWNWFCSQGERKDGDKT